MHPLSSGTCAYLAWTFCQPANFARLPDDDTRLRTGPGLLDFDGGGLFPAISAMPLDKTEQRYLEHQVTLARAVLVALSLVALLETSREPVRRTSIVFLCVYLLVA